MKMDIIQFAFCLRVKERLAIVEKTEWVFLNLPNFARTSPSLLELWTELVLPLPSCKKASIRRTIKKFMLGVSN